MKKGMVARWKRPLAAALGALLVLSAVCGAGSALPERVRDALPEGVREVLTPVTAQAASGDAAIVMETASVLGDPSDYNQTHTDTQIVHYGGQRWYVIGYDSAGVAAKSGTMTLISVGNLEVDVQFNPDPSAAGANHYDRSTLQSKVNAFASVFSSGEQIAVIPRTLTSGTYNTTNPWETDCVAGSQVTDAILWPLSTKEANAMNDNLRRLDGETGRDLATDYWWLRSPGIDVDLAAVVDGDGLVNFDGLLVISSFGVRPAFNVNLQSVIFTSAAEGGKSSGTVGAGALTSVGTNTGNEWKLTLKDASRSGFTASTTSYDSSTGVLTFTYSDAVLTEDNDFVSIIVTDSTNTIKYYGRVVSNATASGNSATVNLSGKINTGDKVYAFNERVNENKKTDYASDVQELQLATPTIAYTVKFQGNGADGGSMTDQNRTVGDGKALDENKFSLTGYTFTGWNTQADGNGTPYTDKATGDLRTTAGEVTLFAQWSSNTTAPRIVTTSPLPEATAGAAYRQTLAATGTTPITWTIDSGALPAGLSLDRSSGEISGTPTTAGTYTFTVKAENNAGHVTATFTITVKAATPAPTPTPTPSGTCATGHATYHWITVRAADEHNDGEMVYLCSSCGHELYRVTISGYSIFSKNTMQKILDAPQGATISVSTRRWISFHRMVYQALADRPDVTLKVSFLDGEYRGNRYSVTIPAGSDPLSLLNGTDYCGFLYLGSKFGLSPGE